MPFTDDFVLADTLGLRPFHSIHFPAIVLITDTDTGKQISLPGGNISSEPN